MLRASIGFVLLCLSGVLVGQVKINELAASNVDIINDPDYGDDADWIELYNTGSKSVDLYHYYLSDNLNNPVKWQFTDHVVIEAGKFLLIWADGMNTGVHTGFGLSKDGEQLGLFSPDEELIDSLSFGPQITNISYGRSVDGAGEWSYFTEPTPGASNTTTAYPGFVEAKPDFSVNGGIYSGSLSVELSSVLGGTIRYTTDGSRPDQNSTIYSGPIPVDETSIIRARIFLPGLIPGTVVTNSYFMDDNFEERNLPVISIATEEENFWDPEVGIYVQDFKPEWEIPVNIEMFENNGSDRAAFNSEAGIKVNGLYSWQLPQKMLGVYFRKQYGSGSLDYPLFFEKARSGFEDFALRASGSDWSYTMFRDMLGHDAILQYMDLDIMAFRPSVVYVNGQYLGIHNIREKVDQDYIVGNYGLAPGTFDLIENEDYAEEGSLDAYNEFLGLLEQNLANDANFNAVAELMDIENFTDLAIAEVCVANTSIDHNVMAWKPKSGGKWRWVVMDLDRGFFNSGNYLIDYYAGRDVLPLKELLTNDAYKEYFGKKLADHVFVTFNPLQLSKLIDKHMKDIEVEMPRHIDRWEGTTSSYGNAIPSMSYWYQEIEDLRTFTEERPGVLMDDLTSYGFKKSVSLNFGISPHDAGFIYFNGLKIPDNQWNGLYPDQLTVDLEAKNRPGYEFIGWREVEPQTVIEAGSAWKYLDDGSNQGTGWSQEGFDDSSWKTGNTELGYGDGDEAQVISYGSSSSSKYITYYFRKTIQLTTADLNAAQYLVKLVKDDGAVVYINGTEAFRTNMPGGTVTYQTEALSAMSNSDESAWNQFQVDGGLLHEGENVIAVEVHQNDPGSSDISFNLSFIIFGGVSDSYISANPQFSYTINGSASLLAEYQGNSACLIPDTIYSDYTLDIDCSPWLASGDVVVMPGATLTVEPGVEVQLPSEASVYIYGRLLAEGTEEKPILFTLNPEYSANWGALFFQETSDTSKLFWTTVEKASHGPGLFNAVAAVSAYKAKLQLDHVTIVDIGRNPVAARYSDVVMTNSSLHSEITGDLINVKYGTARIENCNFIGNDKPDTDAIDYDDVVNGIIRGCTIRNLRGFNSDAIDIGEKAENILIEDNIIYNITDKGVSVGQKSTASVINNLFINCNLGLGLKDSCHVFVDHCTFYNVGTPVACFEKNLGSAGGNAVVMNSILSNAIWNTWSVDSRSSIRLEYNLSDNDRLPDGESNLFDDPLFTDPTHFNFSVVENSPCIGAGYDDGHSSNLGAVTAPVDWEPPLIISNVFYNPEGDPAKSEFITLYNPSDTVIDLSGYMLSEAVEMLIPDGTNIDPGEILFLVKDMSAPSHYAYSSNVLQWDNGSLANEGESIILSDNFGIVQDKVAYSPDLPWPDVSGEQKVISLIDISRDNHFGKNWTLKDYSSFVDTTFSAADNTLFIYPNPASYDVWLRTDLDPGMVVSIIDLSGKIILTSVTEDGGLTYVNVSSLKNGFYLVRAGDRSGKLVISGKQ